jgi:hypothetical protein
MRRMATIAITSIMLAFLVACSTGRKAIISTGRTTEAVPQATPVGTFIDSRLKLRLNADGTFLAEDIGPPEFWNMVEGTRSYPQRVKFPPQNGHWTWDNATGQLTFATKKPGSYRWSLGGLRFDSQYPNRLAWGTNAHLLRVE